MNEDGTMARFEELNHFANEHHIPLISINDLISYRFRYEKVIEELASAELPLDVDPHFVIKIFRNRYDKTEHVALIHRDVDLVHPVLVRIHSECLTGDTFGSIHCDCGWQLHEGLKKIAQEKGILLYMRQEGRGIGLGNKIRAYQLQSQGLDTVEANHQLGFLADHRHYGMSSQMLHHLGVQAVRLLTNNPRKIQDIEQFGIQVVERIPHELVPTERNIQYLKTKRDKLGHWLKLS
jgi:3,4-dihydroxy 2-butanone 4-phosphate synthase/GTP cyclohydrolase II